MGKRRAPTLSSVEHIKTEAVNITITYSCIITLSKSLFLKQLIFFGKKSLFCVQHLDLHIIVSIVIKDVYNAPIYLQSSSVVIIDVYNAPIYLQSSSVIIDVYNAPIYLQSSSVVIKDVCNAPIYLQSSSVIKDVCNAPIYLHCRVKLKRSN